MCARGSDESGAARSEKDDSSFVPQADSKTVALGEDKGWSAPFADRVDMAIERRRLT